MITGFLESVDQFQVRGWAYEAECPDAFLNVEVFCNGRYLGTATANLYRDDLERAAIGCGNHAFIFNLEGKLAEANFAQIKTFAVAPAGQKSELPINTQPTTESQTSLPKLEFEGITCDDKKNPVFVLGAARSGTSAAAQALLGLPRFEGAEEGHTLDLLAHFAVCLDNFYNTKADELGRNTMLARVPQKYFDDAIDHMFRDLAEKYYRRAYWVEKTPNSNLVYIAPRLLKIWPKAKFVFMKRRGIENIRSRERKFPKIEFTTHCREWASAMTAWRLVGSQLRGRAIEIDQLCLVQQPRAAAVQLGRFLELDEIEIDRVSQYFSVERPQRTEMNFSSVLDPNVVDWDTTKWSTFSEICAESMRAFKYGFGSDYYEAGDSDEMVKFI